MEKKKLLILGSDVGTIDVVNEAHNMGIYVIVSDLMETSPTREAADETWNISTIDIDTLEKRCREEHVNGVMTGSSEFNFINCRKLCRRLGLPIYCESDETWGIATNKGKFKKLCQEVGASVSPSYYLTDELTDGQINSVVFPVVVKPVDKSGNRGMSYCNNKEELINAYKYARSVSDNETIIVEKQLHGAELAANYIIANGEIQLFNFESEHNQPGERNNIYSMIFTNYKYLNLYLDELNDKVIEVFKRAGCKEGTAWVECMLDEDGHLYLLEMGHRFVGEMIYVPYKEVCGFSLVRWMIELAMGVKHEKEDLPEPLQFYQGIAATYHMFMNSDGEVVQIEGLDEIEKLPNVSLDIPRRIGYIAHAHNNMGMIRIHGENVDHLIQTIDFIN
ncbi:MAG: ATP-grasp domain-containing protein, partial [Bacteroidaceae bacterium]|nr:ATP-grasp domain-containing protein [Bacteroidaceae bacterium]